MLCVSLAGQLHGFRRVLQVCLSASIYAPHLELWCFRCEPRDHENFYLYLVELCGSFMSACSWLGLGYWHYLLGIPTVARRKKGPRNP